MSEKAYLKVNTLGDSTMFSPAGEPLHFKNGVCVIHANKVSQATLQWLNKEGEASGITLMDEAAVKEYEAAKQAEIEAEQKRAARQAATDALIQGRDPELIMAQTATKTGATPTIKPASSSIQAKIAEAKAAAGKS